MEKEYVALDQATAWNVEQGLESKRVGLADTLAVVAGIMVALRGPFFLLKIKDYDASGGILVLGVIGFSLSVLSLVMAVPVDFANMKAAALNPHYYFLLGEEGGFTGSSPAVA